MRPGESTTEPVVGWGAPFTWLTFGRTCCGPCRTCRESGQCPPCLGFRWARGQMRGWGALSWPPSTTCGPGVGMSRGYLGAVLPVCLAGFTLWSLDLVLSTVDPRRRRGLDSWEPMKGCRRWLGGSGLVAACLGPCSGSCGVLTACALTAAWYGFPCTRPASRAAGPPCSQVCRSSVHFTRCLLILFAKGCCQSVGPLSVTLFLLVPPKPAIWKEHTDYRQEHPLTYLGQVLSALCHQQENRGLESWGSLAARGPGVRLRSEVAGSPQTPSSWGASTVVTLMEPPHPPEAELHMSTLQGRETSDEVGILSLLLVFLWASRPRLVDNLASPCGIGVLDLGEDSSVRLVYFSFWDSRAGRVCEMPGVAQGAWKSGWSLGE